MWFYNLNSYGLVYFSLTAASTGLRGHPAAMGETISKSEGKVYQGDVVDYKSASDGEWHVAEIIEVNSAGVSPGLTLLCKDTSEVAFVNFSIPEQKKRVARAGTHSGSVGFQQARRTRTRTVASPVHKKTLPPSQLKSVKRHSAPAITSKQTSIKSPKIPETSATTSSPGRYSAPHASAGQLRLLDDWKVDSLIDYLPFKNFDSKWRPGKIASVTFLPGQDNIAVHVHPLGTSGYCNETIIVNPGKIPHQLASFGSRSQVFDDLD